MSQNKTPFVTFINSFLTSKKKQKLAEVPKSYCGLPKMGIFELSHIDDFHFSLLLRLTLFESSETTNHTTFGCVPRLSFYFAFYDFGRIYNKKLFYICATCRNFNSTR
jgi:hypothetical protein